MNKIVQKVSNWPIIIGCIICLYSVEVKAQKGKFSVSGLIQTQYQNAQPDAGSLMKVGGPNENLEENYNRIGIRRGQIKFAYEEGITTGVFMIDMNESEIVAKDIYLNIKDPWIKTSNLRAGLFNRIFGYEVSYSSSLMESPERATITQTLFPQERDLGAAIYLQPDKTSPLHFLRLDAGFFSGNGIKREPDNRLDFIGRLHTVDKIGQNINYGIGVSYYNGGVMQGSKNVYRMEGNAFVLSSDSATNFKKFAKREYIGFDLQTTVATCAGTTKLHAEYLFGQQPGTATSSKSPNTGILPEEVIKMNPGNTRNDTYIRDFRGGYVMLTQDIGKLPFVAVLKYDWYDPNTRVLGNEVGQNGTGLTDLAQNTLGLGVLWKATNNLQLTAYYEINHYEKTNLTYTFTNDSKTIPVNDLKRNVFTLRLQYKF